MFPQGFRWFFRKKDGCLERMGKVPLDLWTIDRPSRSEGFLFAGVGNFLTEGSKKTLPGLGLGRVGLVSSERGII